MIRFLFFLFLIILRIDVSGQLNPMHHYTFNNCNGEDIASGSDGFIFGLSDCPCGVDGFALDLGISGQFADFPKSLNDVFREDFTFSFYMWPRSTVSGSEAIDIWSVGEKCSLDSIFQIRYFPINGEMRVRISDQPRNGIDMSGFLTQTNCWSYIAITKEGQEYKLYIDNALIDNAFSPTVSSFENSDVLTLSVGPCIDMQGVAEYEGLIDELRIYNSALTVSELQEEDFFPDQIIEDKIVIFKGESVILETGGTCSNDFSWTPQEGLSNASSLAPVATPESSTTYSLNINYEDCQVADQIDIIVVDIEELDCSQLLLPSAFTPNGDGLNDVFGISNGFILDDLLSFEIFDKWGGRLFFATENNPEWNGNHKNSPVMPGPYVYRIKYVCNGEESLRNGIVNVIR